MSKFGPGPNLDIFHPIYPLTLCSIEHVFIEHQLKNWTNKVLLVPFGENLDYFYLIYRLRLNS